MMNDSRKMFLPSINICLLSVCYRVLLAGFQSRGTRYSTLVLTWKNDQEAATLRKDGNYTTAKKLTSFYKYICVSHFIMLLQRLEELSKFYHTVFNNASLQLVELIMLDSFGYYTYIMKMSPYSVVLALKNAHSGIGASSYGKIMTKKF